ncbi:MAG: NAD(+) synthase, partial [Clostridia bacterium]|nr:NAD(+) synthase [Clostridia bacterium]
AKKLMELLNVTALDINISNAVTAHLADIGADIGTHDVVYENAQARERAQVAFDIANKYNAIVLGTGDMSEAALGFCTFGGDTLGHYNVNATVPKTVMQQLVRQLSAENEGELGKVLLDIVETPISPELKEGQVTEDIVGPYVLHDFIMYYFAKLHLSKEEIRHYMLATFEEYVDDEIDKWLDVFFNRFKGSRFKRAAACEGANLIGFTLPYIPADAEM